MAVCLGVCANCGRQGMRARLARHYGDGARSQVIWLLGGMPVLGNRVEAHGLSEETLHHDKDTITQWW